MTTKTKIVTAIIDRDAHKIPVQVYEHELPILEAAHGIGSVQVLAGEKPKKGEVDTRPQDANIDDAQEEWERLNRKYRNRGTNPVLLAYPGGLRQFERVIDGSPEPGAQPAKAT